MTGANVGFPVGAVSAFVWRQTDGGIATGQLDPDNLVADTTSHAYRLPGLVSAVLPAPTYERATDRGDMSIRGQMDLGASDFGSFDVTLSNDSATLKALLGDSSVDTTTLSNAYISSVNTGLQTPPVLGMMFSTYFQSRDSATSGSTQYRTVIFPRVQIRYIAAGASQDGGVNPNPITLTCTPTEGGKFPGGNAFGANQGWASNRTLFYEITAAAPFALTSYVQDGVTTSYTLTYLPTSTETGATDHIFTVNGTVTAPTTVNTSTGVVTLAAAGTSGQVSVALYQTLFATA